MVQSIVKSIVSVTSAVNEAQCMDFEEFDLEFQSGSRWITHALEVSILSSFSVMKFHRRNVFIFDIFRIIIITISHASVILLRQMELKRTLGNEEKQGPYQIITQQIQMTKKTIIQTLMIVQILRTNL